MGRYLSTMDVRPMLAHELETVVRLWHETCRDTYTFIALERDRPLSDRLRFFTHTIVPQCSLWVAVEEEAINGYMALRDSYIDRLYVRPSAQRRGVGLALVSKARELSPHGLELHTHQKNSKACSFYEKHGFRVARFGISSAPENEPDVLYRWRPS